jgi:hypothetical protein
MSSLKTFERVSERGERVVMGGGGVVESPATHPLSISGIFCHPDRQKSQSVFIRWSNVDLKISMKIGIFSDTIRPIFICW